MPYRSIFDEPAVGPLGGGYRSIFEDDEDEERRRRVRENLLRAWAYGDEQAERLGIDKPAKGVGIGTVARRALGEVGEGLAAVGHLATYAAPGGPRGPLASTLRAGMRRPAAAAERFTERAREDIASEALSPRSAAMADTAGKLVGLVADPVDLIGAGVGLKFAARGVKPAARVAEDLGTSALQTFDDLIAATKDVQQRLARGAISETEAERRLIQLGREEAKLTDPHLRDLAERSLAIGDEPLPIGAEGRFRPPETPFQYNAASLDVPRSQLGEIKATMEAPEILARRRTGIGIDYDDPKKLAAEVGMSEDAFLQAPAGTVWNREQHALLDAYIGRAGRKLEELRAAGKTDTAQFSMLKARWVDLLGTSMAGRSEAGRALESFKHLRTALDSPESLREYLARKVGKKLSEEEIDLLAKTDLDNPAELGDLIAKLQKPKWWEYPRELFYSSILSGLGTHARNTVGNALHAASRIPVRIAGAMVDAPLAKLTGRQRQVYMREVLPSLHGLGEGMMDGLIRARTVLQRGSATGTSKFDVPRSAFARAPNRFVREKVAPVVDIPFRFLTAADELFKGINRGAELRALATRSGVEEGLEGPELASYVSRFLSDPPEAALKKAVEFERVMTFTNPLGPTARHLENLKNSSPFLGYLVPFVRTPVNLFKRGVEFTPAALPRAVLRAVKGADGYAEDMAKVALGTSVMGYAMHKAASGELTGPPPRDAGERDAWYQQGKVPFAFRFGEKWYPVSQLEPVAMPVALAASAWEGFQRGDGEATTLERLQASFALLLANQLDRSYLSGLSDFVELKTLGERALVSFAGRQAAALAVPFSGAMRTVSNAIDPRVVEKRSFGDFFREAVPGLKKGLPARLSRFGEAIARTPWEAAGPSGTFFAPSPVADDEVEAALEELGLRVGFPGQTIEGVRLEPDEYRAFLGEVGPRTKTALATVLRDPAFRELPQTEQQKMLDRFAGSVRDAVRTEALLGAVPGIPPVYAKRELLGHTDRFVSSREKIAQDWTQGAAGARHGVSGALEAKGSAEDAWRESYSGMTEAVTAARRQGLDDAAIARLLQKKGLSKRLARELVAGRYLSYEQYRRKLK